MEVESLYSADQSEKGSEMRVFNAKTGQNSSVYINLKGVDSETYRKAKAEQRQKAFIDQFMDRDSSPEERELEVIVAVTTGWRGLEENGKELKFTKNKARELYKNAPYIFDQASSFVENRANFIEG